MGNLHFVRVTTDAGSLETLSACARSGARGWAGRTAGGAPSRSTRSAPRTVPSGVLKSFSLGGEREANGDQGMKAAKGMSFFPGCGPENDRAPRGDEGPRGYQGESASES